MRLLHLEVGELPVAKDIKSSAAMCGWLIGDGETLPASCHWWLWSQEPGDTKYAANRAAGSAVCRETIYGASDGFSDRMVRGAEAMVKDCAARGVLCGVGATDGAGGIARLSLYVPPGYPMTADERGTPVRLAPVWAMQDELRRSVIEWGQAGDDSPR